MIDKGYTEYTDAEVTRLRKLVDPVDRELLIERRGYDRESYLQGFNAGVRTVLKHAHWIERRDADGDYDECSYCGESLPRYELFATPRLVSIGRTDYCPCCGMRMDEKVSE